MRTLTIDGCSCPSRLKTVVNAGSTQFNLPDWLTAQINFNRNTCLQLLEDKVNGMIIVIFRSMSSFRWLLLLIDLIKHLHLRVELLDRFIKEFLNTRIFSQLQAARNLRDLDQQRNAQNVDGSQRVKDTSPPLPMDSNASL